MKSPTCDLGKVRDADLHARVLCAAAAEACHATLNHGQCTELILLEHEVDMRTHSGSRILTYMRFKRN